MQTQCGEGSLEIEKGFSLYKWPFLANRNWPKKKKKEIESRGVESALPRDYHLNDIDVRYALAYILISLENISWEKYAHTNAKILTSSTFIL